MWALFVPVADWLAHHDVGSVKGSLHETAVDNARGRLLTLGAGLLAAAALVFTALNFNLLRSNSEQTDQWQRRTYELTEQGQVTDRYTKAVEQLGSEKLDVRIGSIYALERVARDSPRDHPTVVEVLAAFIREHSREQWPLPKSDDDQVPERMTRPDVQAALTVIGRRDPSRDVRPTDLSDACLIRAYLNGANLDRTALPRANLTNANLTSATLRDAKLTAANVAGARLPEADLARADLTNADFTRADLSGANLVGANLRFASFGGANLRSANLEHADLTSADLEHADLTSADLRGVDLCGANLQHARLTGADLTSANLIGAHLRGIDLTSADLTSAFLTGAHLDDAKWPADAPVPDGWKLDTDSRRLEAADRGSGPAGAK